MSTSTRLLKEAVRWSSKNKIFICGSSSIFIGSSLAVCKSMDSFEDIKQVGFMRFGRAVIAVTQIVIDYKFSLRNIDILSEEYDQKIKDCHQRSAKRLLQLACANGGVFIKVGQHLAALEYLIPIEYTKTLSVLMSKAPEAAYNDVIYVVESQLGMKIEDLFSEFSVKPIGAASLAQVHIAKLKKTKEEVAIKVQHRRVYKNSRTDMSTMELLVNVADKIFPEFKFMWLVDEIKRNLPCELDFLHEALNADKVRERFKHLKFLKVPRILYDYSTSRVLTMEYCKGEHIDNIEYMVKNRIDRHDVCRKIGRLISEMIFLEGYLHSDPHPGNVLVNKRLDGNVDIVLLDHGLYLNIDDRFRGLYSNLWLALLKPDPDMIKKISTEMGVGELYGLFACIVTRRSWKSVTQGIGKRVIDSTEKDELRMYAASLIPQISEVLHRMPREMLLILKTNDLLRNIEYTLDTTRRADALIEMSKCVIRSHHDLAVRNTNSVLIKLRIKLSMIWSLLKIHAYEYYLIIRDKWFFKVDIL